LNETCLHKDNSGESSVNSEVRCKPIKRLEANYIYNIIQNNCKLSGTKLGELVNGEK